MFKKTRTHCMSGAVYYASSNGAELTVLFQLGIDLIISGIACCRGGKTFLSFLLGSLAGLIIK